MKTIGCVTLVLGTARGNIPPPQYCHTVPTAVVEIVLKVGPGTPVVFVKNTAIGGVVSLREASERLETPSFCGVQGDIAGVVFRAFGESITEARQLTSCIWEEI